MQSLSEHAGPWTGTNGFRLMPADPLHVADATATVSIAAAGNLTSIVYTWSHPRDGMQDGLLVVGSNAEPQGVIALWADSWHQSPEARVLAGQINGGLLIVSCDYGGDWQWQITVDVTNADVLVLRMDNIVPQSAATEAVLAGAYPAMVTELARSPR